MSNVKLLPLLPDLECTTDVQAQSPEQVKAELLGILALTLYLARIEQNKIDNANKEEKRG